MWASSSNGLFEPSPLKRHHEVALLGEGFEDLDVRGREARLDQALFHRARGLRVVAHRVGGVDLDELLVDLAEALLLRRERLGARRGEAAEREGQGQRAAQAAQSRSRGQGGAGVSGADLLQAHSLSPCGCGARPA